MASQSPTVFHAKAATTAPLPVLINPPECAIQVITVHKKNGRHRRLKMSVPSTTTVLKALLTSTHVNLGIINSVLNRIGVICPQLGRTVREVQQIRIQSDQFNVIQETMGILIELSTALKDPNMNIPVRLEHSPLPPADCDTCQVGSY